MKTQKSIFSLTVTALFCALIIAMTFIPYVGYITIPGMLSITTIHVVVLLGVTLFGPAKGTLFGAVWGVSCLVYAFVNGTADALIFQNPAISVLPRILVGLAAGWYYVGLSKLFHKWTPQSGPVSKWMTAWGADTLAALITAILGTLTNTALVLTAISIFGTGWVSLGATLTRILEMAIAVNGIIETVLAAVLVGVLHPVLSQQLRRYL